MKLIIGHILAFLCMTVIIGLILIAVLAVVVGLISFVFWQLPTGIDLENSLMALRLCFGFGSLIGIWFTLDKEGRKFAKYFAEGNY